MRHDPSRIALVEAAGVRRRTGSASGTYRSTAQPRGSYRFARDGKQILLRKLRAAGCRTALDDFGSGLCSFGYLRDLPVDNVKIDGRFVREIAVSGFDASIVRAINEIAHAGGALSVAECVEESTGLAALKLIGVDYGQGYHFGRPEILSEHRLDVDRKAA